jgi:hypothetical protein
MAEIDQKIDKKKHSLNDVKPEEYWDINREPEERTGKGQEHDSTNFIEDLEKEWSKDPPKRLEEPKKRVEPEKLLESLKRKCGFAPNRIRR